MSTAFDRNLDCRPDGDGTYRFEFDDSFGGEVGIFGGLAIAAALRAAQVGLNDSGLDVRSVSASFLSPTLPGPAVARVRPLRRGRTVAQIGVSLEDEVGKPVLETLATFGRRREGYSFRIPKAPESPSPENCPSYSQPPEDGREVAMPPWMRTPMWNAMERRMAMGHFWWDKSWKPSDSYGETWVRFREPPWLDDGTLSPLAVIALTDMLGEGIDEAVGPGASAWSGASIDHYAQWFGPTRSEWLLIAFRGTVGANGYASAQAEVWDEESNLVAVGTQQFAVRKLK